MVNSLKTSIFSRLRRAKKNSVWRFFRRENVHFRAKTAPKAHENLGYFEGFQRGFRPKIGDFLRFWAPDLNNPPLVKSQIFDKGGVY